MKNWRKNFSFTKPSLWIAIFICGAGLLAFSVHSSQALGDYNKATNGTLTNTDWNNLLVDFLPTTGGWIDGNVAIGTSSTSTYALNVSGTISADVLSGALTGSVVAGNVTSGAFGSNYGGGNFSFPGNVGIGTSSPRASLEVVGSGINTIFNITNNSRGGLYIGHGNMFSADEAGLYDLGADKPLVVYDAVLQGVRLGSNISIIEDSKVGIGTTNPEKTLEVYGSSGIRLNLDGTNYLDFSVEDSRALLKNNSGYIELDPNDTNYGLILRDYSSGSSVWSNFRTVDAAVDYLNIAMNSATLGAGLIVTDNDYVGVGKTNPSYPFDVTGDIRSTANVYADDKIITSRYGSAGTYNSAQVQGIWSIGDAYEINTGTDSFGTLYGMGYAYNQNGGSPFASEHQIVFTNNGTINATISLSGKAYFASNVGIGTTAPTTAKLVVNNGGSGYSIDVSSSKIGNLAAGTEAGDAVNYSQMMSAIASSSGSGVSYWSLSGSNLFASSTSYNVGIGTTDPGSYKLKVAGNVAITGTLQTQTGSDFAEEFFTDQDLEPGTVVVMGDLGYKSVKPCTLSYDSQVVGIVSDNPSIIAGRVEGENKAIVAMMGVVSVKASTINGAIKRGDLLVSSGIKGYAMKSLTYRPGTIIGKALEGLKKDEGMIKVLVNLQ